MKGGLSTPCSATAISHACYHTTLLLVQGQTHGVHCHCSNDDFKTTHGKKLERVQIIIAEGVQCSNALALQVLMRENLEVLQAMHDPGVAGDICSWMRCIDCLDVCQQLNSFV